MINKEKSLLQRVLPHVGAILCFLAVTFIYFSPLLEGKVLSQGDNIQYVAISQELRSYYNEEGVASVWTGSAFSGMPAYQIGVWGMNPNLLDYIEKPLKMMGSGTAGPVFLGMLTAYLLFCVTGIGRFSSVYRPTDNKWALTSGFNVMPAILGAIAFSLCSYNIIIVATGHVTKAWAIAYMPLIVAGLLMALKKKYLLGGLLMAVVLALQIKNNHLQITYYTGLLCIMIYLGYLIKDILQKDVKSFLKATGVLTIAVGLAVLSNSSAFYSNYEMAEESTRGQSELSQPTESEKQSSGLDRDYAFAWSYGKAETFSLLVPDIMGGSSRTKLDTSSNTYKQLKANGAQVGSDGVQMPVYWGDQPFTEGPVYFGAVICFLFLLGMIIIKSRLKWILLAATVLFIFLSWGKNFGWFNDLFFYHFPFYNKFRAVSMALVVPALTMLIVAVWAVRDFFVNIEDTKRLTKALYISAGVTGGLCLFFWLLPDFFFNFTSELDARWSKDSPAWLYNAILEDRKALLSSDALRSFIFILLSALLLWVAVKRKFEIRKAAIVSMLLAVLVTVDLWGVDKRYLNNDSFQNKLTYTSQLFRKTNADNIILQDKGISHRVLNLQDPFNEANTSYYHKSVGGYHAAKLKRYQELIEFQIAPEISQIIQSFNTQDLDSITANFARLPVLNMLNSKYIIFNPEQPPLVNPYALGNAWFVSDYKFVNNADEEIIAVGKIDPAETAIVDKRFEQELAGFTIVPDSAAAIVMTEYKPDGVKYRSNAATEQLAVFSEVYYKNGWEAYIDGELMPHFRADWTLRAMRVPAGEHEIEFKFVPHGYYTARTVSIASSGLMILLLLGSLVVLIRKGSRAKDAE